MKQTKQAVHHCWNAASCGETQCRHGSAGEACANEAAMRDALEPYIPPFADFASARDKKVLEIGVGLGADHCSFAKAGARLTGADLTERAIQHTTQRLTAFGLQSQLRTVDAKDLPFRGESFDIVCACGVLHHSPDTPKATDEVWRVLRPGGCARITVHDTHSMVGCMLRLRCALLGGRPLRWLADVCAEHLHSPRTKADTVAQAQQLFKRFTRVEIETVPTHGELLTSDAGQRHRGMLLNIAKAIWRRWFIRTFLPRHGLFLLAPATK